VFHGFTILLLFFCYCRFSAAKGGIRVYRQGAKVAKGRGVIDLIFGLWILNAGKRFFNRRWTLINADEIR
jgi:hypothetical protein